MYSILVFLVVFPTTTTVLFSTPTIKIARVSTSENVNRVIRMYFLRKL